MKKSVALTSVVIMCVVSLVLLVIVFDSSEQLFYSNVNALSQVEEIKKQCVNLIISDPEETEIYCGTCNELPGRGKKESFCP